MLRCNLNTNHIIYLIIKIRCGFILLFLAALTSHLLWCTLITWWCWTNLTYGSNYGSFFVNSPKIWCRLLPFCATEALYLCFFGDNNAFSHLLLPRVQLVVSVSLSDELHAISGPRKFTDMRIHYYMCQWALVIITNCTRVVCKLTRVSRKRGGSRRSTCRRNEPQRERENTFKEPNKVCLHKIAECVVQDLHPPPFPLKCSNMPGLAMYFLWLRPRVY